MRNRNSHFFKWERFIKELRAIPKPKQEKMKEYFLLWIIKLNYLRKENFYDTRNEYSVNIAEKLGIALKDEIEEVKKKYDNYDGGFKNGKQFETKFINKMGNTHRTLIQSFSSVVFEGLTVFDEIREKIEKSILDKKFYKTPMI